jgi:hypothetical protein
MVKLALLATGIGVPILIARIPTLRQPQEEPFESIAAEE